MSNQQQQQQQQHRLACRIDRFAQMNKQEELIAKKRQEILEKQRTVELAKAVAAAQNLSAKLKNDASTVELDKEVTAKGEDEKQQQEEELQSQQLEVQPTIKANSSMPVKSKFSIGNKRAAAPVPAIEQAPPKIQNFFCNDGSFLDHFKKILEKHETKPTVLETTATQAAASAATNENVDGVDESKDIDQKPAHPLAHHTEPLPPPPQQPQFLFEASNILKDSQVLPPQQQHHTHPQLQPVPVVSYVSTPAVPNPPLLQQQQPVPAYFTVQHHQFPPPPPPVSAVSLMGLTTVANTPPPPPPPPQLPMALTNMTQLYMIPAPEPLQLNTIPSPKEFDLNAIPKPQLNLDAIKVPAEQTQKQQKQHFQQQQQQMQQQIQQQQQLQQQQLQQEQILQQLQQQKLQQEQLQQQLQQQQLQQQQLQQQHQQQIQVFSGNNVDQCLQIPTTIETLIALVADNGDDYEDKICSRKNDLHPNMWFLFDKSSDQYHNYRQQLNEKRRSKQQQIQLQKQQQEEQQNNISDKYADEEPTSSTFLQKDVKSVNVTDGDKYDPESIISGDVDSDDEYMRGMMDRNTDNIKRRIECRNELSEEERQEEERLRVEKKKTRKSRWGEKVEIPEDSLSSPSPGIATSFGNQHKPLLSTVTRTDPQLLQYARLNYGSINLSEEDWNKCEEHYKVNLLYQDMMRKRQEIDRLARNGKFKYEYDSDEDVDGGTWEHKLRCAEMEATQAWAQALTKQSEGKHHIGDFLPPEELKKFMEQYEAKKSDRQPDLSDYKEYKLKEDNIGFQMLQKLGWKEGQGLGSGGVGIVDPVNKATQREGNQGLGVISAATPEDNDNEYDAYRKRMMLAYRFRPNPLNNPRRAYY